MPVFLWVDSLIGDDIEMTLNVRVVCFKNK